jgi:hypothetical protein
MLPNNQLTILEKVSKRGEECRYLCKCACGQTTEVLKQNLKTGHTKSCGCLRATVMRNISTTHGQSKTPTYKSWKSMRARCLNSKNPRYGDYGGRGITICNAWDQFETFLKDMGDCPHKHTLERKNVNGNYEKGNCVWATRKQQSLNTRRTVSLTFEGTTLCASEWADKLSLPRNIIYRRLRRGWSVEKTLTEPIRQCKKPDS